MSNEENRPNIIRRRIIPAAVLLAIALGLAYAFTRDNNQPQASEPTPNPFAGDFLTPTLPASSEQPPTPSTYNPLGIVHPYTHLLYLYANDPPGYEGWDCFHVPEGNSETTGTTWGAVLVGGLSALTIDTTQGAAFLNGPNQPPVTFNAASHPDSWPAEVRVVHKNDVVCSK